MRGDPPSKVRVGLRLEPRVVDAARPADLGEIIDLGRRLDASVLDILWVSERPFAADGSLSTALPVCAALAAATERLHIGAGVLPLPLHHPLRLAEDAGTLAAVAGPRLELAVGLGGDASGFEAFGVDPGERVARFEEAYAILERALRGEPLRGSGRFYDLEEVQVMPLAVDTPPLWIGAGVPAAVRRAARLGAGLLAASEAAVHAFVDAWREAGHEPADGRVALTLPPGAGIPEPPEAWPGQLDWLVRASWPPPPDAPLERAVEAALALRAAIRRA